MTILEKILAQKQIEVEFAKTKIPLNDLRRQALYKRQCFSLVRRAAAQGYWNYCGN